MKEEKKIKSGKRKIDYVIPIGLSTLETIGLFVIFLIYWGLGNGHIKYIYAAIIVILVTYIAMFYTTSKHSRKVRVILFLTLGFSAFFFSLLSLLGDVIGYKLSILFYDIAGFLAIIFVLGLGFLIGNILLIVIKRFRR